MLPFKVALPTGHPPSDVDPASRTSLADTVRTSIVATTGTPFGPNSTRLRFRFNAPGRTVNAMFPGQLTAPGPNNLISIELSPAQARHLLDAMPPGCPAPRHVTISPVALSEDVTSKLASGAVSVKTGEAVGTLTGDTLALGFLDEKRHAIEPSWCLHLFDDLGAWDLTDASRNPLQAFAALPNVVSLLGSGPATGPALTLRSATGRVRFIHPPASVEGALLPFVASDSIFAGLLGVPAGTRWRVAVQDLGGGGASFTSPYSAATEVSFRPQRDLPAASAGAAARRLRYRIAVEFETAGLPSVSPVEVRQDVIDQLRQEYEDASLDVPARARFGYVPGGRQRIDEAQVYANNDYFAAGVRVGLDPETLPVVADALALAFERSLHRDGIPEDDPRNWLTSDLRVVDGYHSPRRHASLPGVQPGAAMHGFYLKVQPRANSQATIVGHHLLAACLEVMNQLLSVNPTVSFSRLEARLLSVAGDPCWGWTMDAGANVSDGVIPGPFAPPDVATAFRTGGFFELFFVPSALGTRLAAPHPLAKVHAPTPGTRSSLILIGDEVAGAEKQIPLDDAAYTLRQWLLQKYPDDVAPRILVTRGPMDVWKHLGVIGDRPVDFRFVFTMSHSYAQGLLFFHREPVALDAAGWPERYIHDAAVGEQMKDLYGYDIVFGSNDVTQYSTQQMRVSHIRNLPDDMKRRLRANLERAEVFLIGCNSNPADNTEAFTTVTEAFADASGAAVWGASKDSKFIKKTSFGWLDHDELRGAGTEGEYQVVMLPDDPGFTWTGHDISEVDPVDVYRQGLIKVEPKAR